MKIGRMMVLAVFSSMAAGPSCIAELEDDRAALMDEDERGGEASNDSPCIVSDEEIDDVGMEANSEVLPAVSCPSGWHYHWTTWPWTGFYYVGNCSSHAFSVPNGTGVCMMNAPSDWCVGQGYSRVYRPGIDGGYYWARTEAFNGH